MLAGWPEASEVQNGHYGHRLSLDAHIVFEKKSWAELRQVNLTRKRKKVCNEFNVNTESDREKILFGFISRDDRSSLAVTDDHSIAI